MNRQAELTQFLQTPTFGLTVVSIIALAARCLGVRRADSLAAVSLGLVGYGGLLLALHSATQRTGQPWGWKGLFLALRRADPDLRNGVIGHLPQAIAATILINDMRRASRRRR